jgi:hypothetical protein
VESTVEGIESNRRTSDRELKQRSTMHCLLFTPAVWSPKRPGRASCRLNHLFVLFPGLSLHPHPTGDCYDAMADSSNTDPDRSHVSFHDLWSDALRHYQNDTGRDLSQVSHFDSLLGATTVEEICAVLQKREESFKTFRAHGEKIRKLLAPVVRLVQLFVDAGAEATSSFVWPPSYRCCMSLTWNFIRERFLVER